MPAVTKASVFPAGTIMEINCDGVNFRLQADLNSAVIGRLNKGYRVTTLGKSTTNSGYVWEHVQFNGKIGWVASQYLQLGYEVVPSGPTVIRDGQRIIPEILNKDSANNNIKEAQTILTELHLYYGPIDGQSNLEFEEALTIFKETFDDYSSDISLDSLTLARLRDAIKELHALPQPDASNEPRDYFDSLSCFEFKFEDTKYTDGRALFKILQFAGQTFLSALEVKAMIAIVAVSASATGGAALLATFGFGTGVLKAVADIGVYGALTACASILFVCDNGFYVGEADSSTPLGAVYSVGLGYPYLRRLETVT